MRYLLLTTLALAPITVTMDSPPEVGGIVVSATVEIVDNTPAEEKCLATMIYGEARSEPELGQVAVAYTAMNRARNRSVCDVILAPKQYSVFNGNPDLKAAAMSLDIEPKHKNYVDQQAWPKAMQVAKAVFHRKVSDPTYGSTHYLAPVAMSVLGYKYPRWAEEYKHVTTIHGHKFFKYQRPKKEKTRATKSI